MDRYSCRSIHDIRGNTHPARPFLSAGAVHRAHLPGRDVGDAPVPRNPAHPRRRPAGSAGRAGDGAEGFSGADPGPPRPHVPVGLQRPSRLAVGGLDGSRCDPLRTSRPVSRTCRIGGLLHHNSLRVPGLFADDKRHPGAVAYGTRRLCDAVHPPVRGYPGFLVSDPPDRSVGFGFASGGSRVAGGPVHRVDGMAWRHIPTRRSPAAGVGRPRVHLPGVVRGQIPPLRVPVAAFLHLDGRPHAPRRGGMDLAPPANGFAGSAKSRRRSIFRRVARHAAHHWR